MAHDEGDYLGCVSSPSASEVCKSIVGPDGVKVSSTALPTGTRIRLTGTVRHTMPYGNATSFSDHVIYFEDYIHNKRVWIADFFIDGLGNFSGSKMNVESRKSIGPFDWPNEFRSDYWKCPLGHRDAIKINQN